MFLLGGRQSVDTIILLFCPFVSDHGERVNPVGWDVTSAVGDANQKAFWHDSAVCLCLDECVSVCVRGYKQNRP